MHRLHTACKVYQEQTGSEWMWDQYENLIEKIHFYAEEYCPDASSNADNL